jgi:hypothetical protein
MSLGWKNWIWSGKLVLNRSLCMAVAAAALVAVGSGVSASEGLILPISKSTQAVPVPPVPPVFTAVLGPNAAAVVGAIGVPAAVTAVVVVTTVVVVVATPTSSTTTTTTTSP